MTTRTHNEPSSPLLVVDEVRRDPAVSNRLIGKLRFVGHQLSVVLDFPREPFRLIEYVDIPWLLGGHVPSQQAVVRLLARIDAGEVIGLPCDLSDEVLAADPHCPFQAPEATERARLEVAASEVPLEVRSIQRTGSYPVHISAHLLLAGQPLFLEVEWYGGAGSVPVMRLIRWPDPGTFTGSQLYAIQRALSPPTEV